ncbi:phosphotransferase family protein [Sphingomonas sp.]|jgi:hypothetical protein|uniref:phosphotransferase family protein n=1 Tax=Sphingomonas sp. TaxID=28214 RepID=UPI002D7F4DAE|nr:phosphotransferase [Sphingomonas sp.]HEU0045858.1 phosphotransferase [Sphingomonas sp.]
MSELIPVAPDQFTLPWVEQVFGASPGALAGLSHAPVGTGQVCDSYRFACNWRDGALPASFIAKCPSADPVSRAGAALYRLYASEVGWYRDCAAHAGVPCPRPYHAAIDDDGERFVLLLEDMAPLTQGDQIAGGSVAQVAAALDGAAALHAWRPAGGDWARLPWSERSPAAGAMLHAILSACYPKFRARFAPLLEAEVLALADAFVARLDVYLPREDAAECLRHSDLRLDNILFDASGTRAVLLDWQTVTRGQAATDVAYLIGTSFADPATRAAREGALIDGYLARRAALGRPAERDRFWQDYRRNAFAGLAMAINASQYVERTARGDAMFAAMAARPARMAIDLDSLDLL